MAHILKAGTWIEKRKPLKGELDLETLISNTVLNSARVQTVISAAIVTANANINDSVHILAQNEALTLANPIGTAGEDQMLLYRIKDNGVAKAISYGTEFRVMATVLPTTTVVSKTLYLACVRNVTDSKWDVIAVVQQV